MSRDVHAEARAFLDQIRPFAVVCDRGHKKWWINSFAFQGGRWVSGWDHRDKAKRERHETRRTRDGKKTGLVEQTMREFGGLNPGIGPEPQPDSWMAYDLTCPRCKKAGRHVSYVRRCADFHIILDELADLDLPEREVSPAFLLAYETRRGPNGTGLAPPGR
ncbi:hypothetical protein [Ornithinimicrobium sp. Y1694]|uniref:hypothetical protein n=1 Tax=Ornithinimicrobium sp. Y1694 TaxID=3418590 RepID=UPI003CEFB410